MIFKAACVANGCFGYLNSENVRVGVDLWVATIGQTEIIPV